MFTDPHTPANVKSLSDFIMMTWLLPHASEELHSVMTIVVSVSQLNKDKWNKESVEFPSVEFYFMLCQIEIHECSMRIKRIFLEF